MPIIGMVTGILDEHTAQPLTVLRLGDLTQTQPAGRSQLIDRDKRLVSKRQQLAEASFDR